MADVVVKGDTLEAGAVRPMFGPLFTSAGGFYLYDISAAPPDSNPPTTPDDPHNAGC